MKNVVIVGLIGFKIRILFEHFFFADYGNAVVELAFVVWFASAFLVSPS